MRIREAQKHTDPDPQHCYVGIIRLGLVPSCFYNVGIILICSFFRSFSEFVPPSVTTLTLSDNQLLELGRNSSRHKTLASPQSVLRIRIRDPGSWIRDPGWVKNQDPGSGINILDHIFENLETIFWVKVL
jgi:hypothetical protein